MYVHVTTAKYNFGRVWIPRQTQKISEKDITDGLTESNSCQKQCWGIALSPVSLGVVKEK